MKSTKIALLILLAMSLMSGCGHDRHSLNEDEWDQIFGMPADNTQAASELVQRDAESRQQWLSLHEDIQNERSEVGRQRDQLETDRREWDSRERSDSVIASAITGCSIMLVCSFPLILVGILFMSKKPEPADDCVTEILVEDMIAHHRLPEGERRRLNDER